MSKETGGPAFPRPISVNTYNGEQAWDQDGMTLRDYFAAKAMQGILSGGMWGDYDDLVSQSYEAADAMIDERNK